MTTNTEVAMQIIKVALSILNERLLALVALVLNTGVFVWAMSAESWVRIVGAFGFAVASWCIINFKPSQGASNEE